jgi:Protein of unknown function (DUF938)
MADPSSNTPTALETRRTSAGKLFSPSAKRNSKSIVEVLETRLTKSAAVLEIGSGTGEHAEAVCLARPDIRWTPTDPDANARASQAARAAEMSPQLESPRTLDASGQNWWHEFQPVDALVSCNVIHIAPWAVAEGIALGAENLVKPSGFVMLYGPFLTGDTTAPSNLAFNENLKARNPEWGVRPLDAVTALFVQHSFVLQECIEMPANNLSLIFRKCEP